MTATIEPQFRRMSAFGWAEFLPRNLLVEAACRGRRVLEVGTQDPRGLLRLKSGGASRILGTTPEPDRVDPQRLLNRTSELSAMADGAIEFEDGAFDVILVVDLARQLASTPNFLAEVRRVLAPDGFVLLGFESGRGLSRLVERPSPPPPLEPKRLERAVREVFGDARFYQQTPFIGVAIHPAGADDAKVAVDPSFAARTSRPSHVIALAGRGAPESVDSTLVELPFLDFEATAQAAQARSAADVERLMEALADARSQVAERDESLRRIGARLPMLRRAFEAKLAAMGQSGQEPVGPLALEAAEDAITQIPVPLDEPLDTAAELEALRRQNVALQERLEALNDTELPNDTIISGPPENALLSGPPSDSPPTLPVDTSRLRAELADAQASLEIAEQARRTSESQELEAHQRIAELERALHERDRLLASLETNLQNQRSSERALGADYQDAEGRAAQLAQKLDEAQFAHANELRELEWQLTAMAEKLKNAGGNEQELEAEVRRLTLEREEASNGVSELQSELVGQREAASQLKVERDQLRIQLQEREHQIEHLERRVADQAQALAQASGVHRMATADRRAVELAASHMAKEVESLRERVQALRNERDALAATSKMLLDERDADAASRTGDGQAALARLETELAAAQALAEAHKKALHAETERRKTAEASARGLPVAPIALHGADDLQDVLHEVTMKASSTAQALAAAERRCRELEATAGDSLDQVGRALSAKAEAEARLVEAQRRSQLAQARAATLQAEVATLGQRLNARDQELSQAQATARTVRAELSSRTGPEQADRTAQLGQLEEVVAIARKEKRDLEQALGRTLEEAAVLSGQLQATTHDLEKSRIALDRSEGNRERFAAAVETLRAELEGAVADRDAAFGSLEALRAEMQRVERAWTQSAARSNEPRVDDLRAQIEVLKADRIVARQEAHDADLRARQLAFRLREVQAQLRQSAEPPVVALFAQRSGEDVALLKTQIRDLGDEVDFLRAILADRESELRRARAEAAAVREPMPDRTDAVADGTPSAADGDPSAAAALSADGMVRRAQDAEAQVRLLRASVAEHKTALAEQDQVQVRLTDQVERLQRAVISLEGVAESRASELADAREALAAAERAQAEASEPRSAQDDHARVQNLESALEVARTERDRAEAELDRRNESLAAAQTNAAMLSDKLAAQARAQADVEHLQDRLRETEQERATFQRRLADVGEASSVHQAAARAAEDRASAYARKLGQVEATAAEARAATLAVRTERDDLEEILGGLRASLAESKGELQRLRTAESERQSAHVTAEERLSAAEAVAKGADAQLTEAMANLDTTRRNLEEAEAHIGRLEDEGASLRREAARLSGRVAQLERENAEAATANTVATRVSAELEARASETDAALVTERQRAHDAQRALQDLQAKHDAVRQALEEARSAVEMLRSERDALETERDALVAEVGATAPLGLTGTEASELSEEREALMQTVDALKAELAQARRDRDALARRLEQAEGATLSADEVAALQARVASLDLKSMQDGARLVAAEAEVEMLRGRVERAAQSSGAGADDAESVQALQQRLEAIAAQADNAEARAQHLEGELKHRDMQMRTMEANAPDNVRVQFAQLRNEASRARTALEETQGELGRKDTELRQMREQLNGARTAFAAAEQQIQALKQRLVEQGDSARHTADIAHLRQEVARLKAEQDGLSAERHRLHNRIASVEEQRVQSERRLVELESQLVERDARIDRLLREVREKTERIRKLSGLSEA